MPLNSTVYVENIYHDIQVIKASRGDAIEELNCYCFC
jgi:hypothetical protein